MASRPRKSDPILALRRPLLILDVESIGLHGEGFAVAAIVVDPQLNWEEKEAVVFHCPQDKAQGTKTAFKWVENHVSIPTSGARPRTRRVGSPLAPWIKAFQNPAQVREAFWGLWRAWESKGALLLADVLWPVEANFLSACVADQSPLRELEGPYPFYDIESLRLLVNVPSLKRLPAHLPEHNPLNDVRHSIRTLQAIIAVSAK